MNDYWCIPSKEDADFVACMEDVLDVYELPYDPARPVVCMAGTCSELRECERKQRRHRQIEPLWVIFS